MLEEGEGASLFHLLMYKRSLKTNTTTGWKNITVGVEKGLYPTLLWFQQWYSLTVSAPIWGKVALQGHSVKVCRSKKVDAPLVVHLIWAKYEDPVKNRRLQNGFKRIMPLYSINV